MPNALAYMALLCWPLVMLALFARLRPERALLASIIGAYLLLPPSPFVSFKLPGLPALDKAALPAISAYLILVFVKGHRVPLWPQSLAARGLLALFVLVPFGTALTNPEPIFAAARGALPGLTLYDAFSMAIYQAFAVLAFALARAVLNHEAALKDLLWALVIAILAYSLPMLAEIRLSPQLNLWVYGFFQHSFEQMMRQGGFRPIVFLPHALWLAFLVMMALVAAATLTRIEGGPSRNRNIAITVYLFALLVLCKSLGALIFALAALPLVLVLAPRNMLKVALILAAMTLLYPVLRAQGLIPTEALLDLAQGYSPERAQSLGFRFHNEALLVEHAARKPWFGWGGYDRHLLQDAVTGRTYTIPDGRWIITYGMFGWIGYLAEFGLLSLPLVLLLRQGARLPLAAAALALIHGINLIDLLPNATLTQITWLVAGALLGFAERPVATAAPPPDDIAPATPPKPRTWL